MVKNRLYYYTKFLDEEVRDKFLLKNRNLIKAINLEFKLELYEVLEDTKLVACINFFELLTGQKPAVKRKLSLFKHGKKVNHVVVLVTLRKQNLYNFLDYCLVHMFPGKNKRMKLYAGSWIGKMIQYSLDDLGLFLYIPSIVYNVIKNEKFLVKFMLEGICSERFIKYYAVCMGMPVLK